LESFQNHNQPIPLNGKEGLLLNPNLNLLLLLPQLPLIKSPSKPLNNIGLLLILPLLLHLILLEPLLLPLLLLLPPLLPLLKRLPIGTIPLLFLAKKRPPNNKQLSLLFTLLLCLLISHNLLLLLALLLLALILLLLPLPLLMLVHQRVALKKLLLRFIFSFQLRL